MMRLESMNAPSLSQRLKSRLGFFEGGPSDIAPPASGMDEQVVGKGAEVTAHRRSAVAQSRRIAAMRACSGPATGVCAGAAGVGRDADQLPIAIAAAHDSSNQQVVAARMENNPTNARTLRFYGKPTRADAEIPAAPSDQARNSRSELTPSAPARPQARPAPNSRPAAGGKRVQGPDSRRRTHMLQ